MLVFSRIVWLKRVSEVGPGLVVASLPLDCYFGVWLESKCNWIYLWIQSHIISWIGHSGHSQ